MLLGEWRMRVFRTGRHNLTLLLCALSTCLLLLGWVYNVNLSSLQASIDRLASHTTWETSRPSGSPWMSLVPLGVGIPKIIWYKVGPKGQNEKSVAWTKTCTKPNKAAGYTARFMDPESGDNFVRQRYAWYPELVATYLGLRIPILKADLLRLLLLFAEGGIWMDLDVSCEGMPMDEWITYFRERATPLYRDDPTTTGPRISVGNNNNTTSDGSTKSNIGNQPSDNTYMPGSTGPDAPALVLGIEVDFRDADEPFERGFNSWTFLARAGASHLWVAVEDILSELRRLVAENKLASVADLQVPMVGDIIELSGPRRLTWSMQRSFRWQTGHFDLADLWHQNDPVTVGDVLILPSYAMARTANAYPDNFTKTPELVTHHYAGSWRNKEGGENGRG